MSSNVAMQAGLGGTQRQGPEEESFGSGQRAWSEGQSDLIRPPFSEDTAEKSP